MNNEQLLRLLYRCGMITFAGYYKELHNHSISDSSLQKVLMKNEGYTENSARIKVRSARTIIKYSRSIDALRLIANATMASDETIANARNLLTKLGK